MKKTLIVGTVAYDDIETPYGSSGKILGGSGTYISLACFILSINCCFLSFNIQMV